jgi:hypothetical protein
MRKGAVPSPTPGPTLSRKEQRDHINKNHSMKKIIKNHQKSQKQKLIEENQSVTF